jgi:hypothetical protein
LYHTEGFSAVLAADFPLALWGRIGGKSTRVKHCGQCEQGDNGPADHWGEAED